MNTAQTDNLSTRLAHALTLIDEAIVSASKRLEDGPDNPAIKRLGGKGVTAFYINFAELMTPNKTTGTWDAFTHDRLAQYRYARDLVEKRKFAALRDLLAGSAYRDPSHGVRIFAPEVIEHIKAITGDLRAAAALTDASRMAAGLVDAPVEKPVRSPRMRR